MTTLYRIYGLVDERDSAGLGPVGKRLLYVGITDNYDRRMQQHAEKRWWDSVKKIAREEFPDRTSAEAAERLAIAHEAPLHNKALNATIQASPAAHIPKAVRQPLRKQHFTIAEAAEYLGVTGRTIRRYISQGDLPASRIKGSRLIRIRASDVDALLSPIPTVERL